MGFDAAHFTRAYGLLRLKADRIRSSA
jgi:hypothetical protein